MGISVTVEGITEVRYSVKNFQRIIDSIIEGFAYATDKVIMPELYARSISVWNVRTGMYSMGWFRQVTMDTVSIGNDAPYAIPLERGWTTKKGTHVESPGIGDWVFQTHYHEIARSVAEWIRNRI